MPVGAFPPNGYGLFEMTGNIRNWCWDWFGFYDTHTPSDPRGPSLGTERVVRGGGWTDPADHCRLALRSGAPAHQTTTQVGFRTVLDATVRNPVTALGPLATWRLAMAEENRKVGREIIAHRFAGDPSKPARLAKVEEMHARQLQAILADLNTSRPAHQSAISAIQQGITEALAFAANTRAQIIAQTTQSNPPQAKPADKPDDAAAPDNMLKLTLPDGGGSFFIRRFEVTWEEWDLVRKKVGRKGFRFVERRDGVEDRMPVDCANWRY